MNKDMDFNSAVAEFLHRHGRAILGLFVVALVVHDIFGTHGFIAMRRTQYEIAKVNQDINRLSTENVRLEEEVNALKSDTRYIEKLAREEMGFSRPGDTIIRVPQWREPGQDADAKP